MVDLKNKLYRQMIKSIQKVVVDKKIGIAFSGGVDSSLLAKICNDLGYKIILLTIGFEGSHDVMHSKETANMFGYDHKIGKISQKTFLEISKKINKTIKTDNLSWNENCIAFYHVAKLAKRYGITKVLTANGIDELFCGYNAYREAIKQGTNSVMKLMKSKLENEINMMIAVNTIASEFGVQIIQPFLYTEFISFSKKIPVEEKIHGPDDLIRKHIIRDLALKTGVPQEVSYKRKKALQYSSLIHKTLMKLK